MSSLFTITIQIEQILGAVCEKCGLEWHIYKHIRITIIMVYQKKALIIVDVQKDFLPGGTLPVPHGNDIIPIINQLVLLPFDRIIATQDYHPDNHCSFAHTWKKNVGERILIAGVEQILWPTHCVQGTSGSEFSNDLDISRIHLIIHKGTEQGIDSYSTFFDNRQLRSTGLEAYLRNEQIKELYFAGLATDYCVLYSAIDALELQFSVFVIEDACRGINLQKSDVSSALKMMTEKGCTIIQSNDVRKRLFHV